MTSLPENPLLRNLFATAITIVYVKVVVGLCQYAVSIKVLAPRVSRKCIHVAAGAWIIFWPLFSIEHWMWKLNIVVPFIYTIQLFIKGAIVRDRNDADVQSMSRTGDPIELLNGPILFTMIMNLVGLFCFRHRMGVIIMSCLGFGDGIAPLVGYYFPFGYYPTYPFGTNDRKTLSGSVGFVVASVLGYFIMQFVIIVVENDESNVVALLKDDSYWFQTDVRMSLKEEFMLILQVASLAAITEGISGPFDNPCIAISATFAYKFLATTTPGGS